MKRIVVLILFLLTVAGSAFAKPSNDTTWKESTITLETKTGKLYGTLCTPRGFASGPVALIIAGSGPTDRDGNSPMMKTDAYKILAHKLAENGISTLRYDKRGIGDSRAAISKSTVLHFEDMVSDANGWLLFLKMDKRFTKIIVIGHSEGSLIGMLISKEGVSEFVSIAGPGESGDKILKTQMAVQPKSVQDTAFPIIDSLAAGKLVSNVSQRYYALFRPSVQPYLISWFKYDPCAEIKKLTIPVLILQGTNDLQVSADDAKKLKEASLKAKLILIDSMNHVFKIIKGDKTQNINSYSNPSLPIAPELPADIGDFIYQD